MTYAATPRSSYPLQPPQKSRLSNPVNFFADTVSSTASIPQFALNVCPASRAYHSDLAREQKIPVLQEGTRWQPAGPEPRLARPKAGRLELRVYNALFAPSSSLFILSPSSFFPSRPSISALSYRPQYLEGSSLTILPLSLFLVITCCSALSRYKMAITHLRPNDHYHLQNIANLLGAASKTVTVTGAGIDTNAGIPVSTTTSSYVCLSTALGLSIERWCLFLGLSSSFPVIGPLQSAEKASLLQTHR